MRLATSFFALTMLLSAFLTFTDCDTKPYRMGERLYKSQCSNCHLDQGEGLVGLIPPLAGSDYLANHRNELLCIIRYGLKDTIVVNGKTYIEEMPPNDKISEIQVTNLANFVLENWSPGHKPFEYEEVVGILSNCGKK